MTTRIKLSDMFKADMNDDELEDIRADVVSELVQDSVARERAARLKQYQKFVDSGEPIKYFPHDVRLSRT